MAYKFKVGDRASYKGQEGVIITVDKGVVLNYKVQWKEGHCDWFQGKNLDKVISKPEPPVPPKYGAPKFKVGDKVLITVDNPMCSFYKKDDTGVVAGITSNRPDYVSYDVKSTEEGRTAYVEECYLLPYKSDIIFTTKDGVDIRNGDKVYWVFKIKDEVGINSGTWNKDANGILPDLTYFSSEKLATEYKKELERKTVEFKVGDIVKLTGNRAGSCNQVGDVGEILEIGENQCRVQVPGGDTIGNWSYKDNLELVTTIKQTSMSIHAQLMKESTLKIGDVVKVTHKVPSYNLGWEVCWDSAMNIIVGQEVTVVSNVDNSGFYCKSKSQGSWNFPVQVLEFVRKSKPEFLEMKISKDYDAKVYKDRIEVGCQTITMENFKKLQKLVAEINK